MRKSTETGQEVNALAVLIYIDFLKKRNISAEQILQDTSLSHKELKKFGKRISWSDYATIMHTISMKCGFSHDDFRQLGADALNHPLLHAITYLTSTIMSLPELYETMRRDRLDSPGSQLINCVYVEVDRGLDNSMKLTFKTEEGYTMFPEYLYSTLGTIEAIPTLYGLEPIEVTLEETLEGGSYSFFCPNAEKTLSKIKSFFRMLLKGRSYSDQLRTAYRELNRKSIEQQEQIRQLKETKLNLEMANRTKSEFVARISHELRTPLNGILGMSQLLSDQKITVECQELISQIDHSGHHLLEVINTILDFSRLSNNSWELREKPFSPESVCQELKSHFEQRYHSPRIDFSVTTFPLKGKLYEGDATAFHQVLYNIMDNAFKFTHEGSIKMVATATDKEVAITISDTGIGIPEELQSTIFDSFSQVEDYKTRAHEGTGIGLTVTKKLVELMGGTITIDSTPGSGTWFEVTLPLIRHLAPDYSEPVFEENATLPKAHILLAEDNRVNQIVIEKFFENTPLELTVVENGLDAINAVSTNDFDLILMDIMMPVMSGEEATEAIRAIPKMANLPIIALTANAMEGDRERYLALGMNGYLPKPVSRETLFAKITEHLKGKKFREETPPKEQESDEIDDESQLEHRKAV